MPRHPARHVQSGFTLMDLMIAVAVLGTLFALAIPIYNDYRVRARVAQVLTSIDTLRTVFHTRFEVEGQIPKFSPGKPGEIPPELAGLPIGPELLTFAPLTETLIQSSHHYGPFEGKDIPYLTLTASNPSQARYLRAVAHVLPHNAYAWLLEPTAMIVPLLDAEARHQTVVQAKQQAAVAQQSTPRPLTCGLDHEKVTWPAALSPTGNAMPVCLPRCPTGQTRDPADPTSCLTPATTAPVQPPQPAQVVQVPTPSGSSVQTGAVTPPTVSTTPTVNPHQQYDDCRAHVLADHPHGHAWGLLRQCDRYAH